MKPSTVEVQFAYQVERDPLYPELDSECELRALVTIFGDDITEPVIDPLDKAVWEDALGPQVAYTRLDADGETRIQVASPVWVGAEERALDAALAAITRASEQQPVGQRRAS